MKRTATKDELEIERAYEPDDAAVREVLRILRDVPDGDEA